MNESLLCECASAWGDAVPSGTPVCPPSKAGMFESWSHGVSELEERAGVTLWSCLLCPKAITEFMAPATPDQAVHHLLPGLWPHLEQMPEALGGQDRGVVAPWGFGLTLGSCFSRSFRHCVLRLTENNSQPLMTKLQWLFAFLEHSQVRAGCGCGRSGEGRQCLVLLTLFVTPGLACAWLEVPIVWIELLSSSPCWCQFIAKLPGPFSILMQGLQLEPLLGCATPAPLQSSVRALTHSRLLTVNTSVTWVSDLSIEPKA